MSVPHCDVCGKQRGVCRCGGFVWLVLLGVFVTSFAVLGCIFALASKLKGAGF